MTNFLNDYKKNINNIISLKDTLSGKHSINIDNATKWVNSQLTVRRQKAALNLINNTYYPHSE